MINDLDDLSLEDKLMQQKIHKLANLGTASSDWLAAQVVLYRVLNMEKEVAVACMTELAKRRESGEVFEFENFIEEQVKKMPVVKPLDLTQTNSLMTIQSLTRIITGKK